MLDSYSGELLLTTIGNGKQPRRRWDMDQEPCRKRSTRCGGEFISSCGLRSDRHENSEKEKILVIPEYFGYVNLQYWAGTVAKGAVPCDLAGHS